MDGDRQLTRGAIEERVGTAQTQRYVRGERGVVECGGVQNAGIAAYLCEALSHEPGIAGSSAQLPTAHALAQQVANQAVEVDGVSLWRWEAVPSSRDVLYPADWDDTCKGIDAVRAYEQAYAASLNLSLPSAADIEALLDSTVYVASVAGEDVQIRCRNRLALYIFMSQNKRNNVEDVMVTGATLRCIMREYPELAVKRSVTLDDLAARLLEVARWGLSRRHHFGHISRCYFSWGHFIWVLLDIAQRAPHLQSPVLEIAEMYSSVESSSFWFPTELAPNCATDENMHLARLRGRLGWDRGSDVVHAQVPFAPQFMYQHRRLKHFYGCPEWSRYLTLRQTDCVGAREW